MDKIATAEKLLAKHFSRKHCILTGRATSAICIALRTLDQNSGKVIVPAIMCPNPANAVLYAGLEPVFCDVNTEDYNLDVESLRQALDKDTRAIIVVHLYGHPARMEKIVEIAKEKGVSVIEDVAQAMGASRNGRPLGSFGDMSILSFGSNKIPGLAGGGALLTDDDAIAEEARSLAAALPEEPEDCKEMQSIYRSVYYAVRDLESHGIDTVPFYQLFPEAFKRMYLYKTQEKQTEAIIEGMSKLDDDVASRREKAKAYKKRLKHPLITHPDVNYDEAAFWRYSITYDGDSYALAERIRELGIDASNWYPNIAPWYGCTDDFTGATFIEKHILNLWTDKTKTIEEIREDCKKITKLMEGQE